jgi:uncharacterized tellurite resistance protein B-like protein
MLGLIKSLLGLSASDSAAAPSPRQAVAALMVEAATLDGTFDERERSRALELLAGHFNLDKAGAASLLAEGEALHARSVQLHGMAQAVKNAFDHDQRIAVLEMLWEVVYADGHLHDYEANLLRRLAGLVYVPDQDAGAARKRVVARLGLPD